MFASNFCSIKAVFQMYKLNSSQAARNFVTSSIVANKRLSGKVAIVTGSTDGIGYAIARDLGKNGAKVIVSSRREENVLKATETLKNEGLDVKGVVCHVSNPAQRNNLIDFTMKEYGSIDVLVSNAATNPIIGVPILETDPDAWDKIFDVNVKSAFYLAKSCIDHMKKKGGSIILVSSIAGFHPVPGIGAYSVSKAALFNLAMVLNLECAKFNVRVNCIAPGVIETKFSTALLSDPKFVEYIMKVIPQKRLGTPEDIAGLATYLASDESSYLAGETISVTGGSVGRL